MSRRNASTAEEAEAFQQALLKETERSLARDPSRWTWKWRTTIRGGTNDDTVKESVARSKASLNPLRRTATTQLREGLWDWSWRKEAACVGEDPDLFYPEQQEVRSTSPQTRKAKSICGGCSVRKQCLAVALAVNVLFDDGIWGGLTAGERRALRNPDRLKRAAAKREQEAVA